MNISRFFFEFPKFELYHRSCVIRLKSKDGQV